MTVLHRVLLSLDDIQTQENIIDIVHRCVQAYLEKIDAEQEEQEEELREVEFVSKKSLVFSGLEICLYIVGKYTNDILPEKARQNIVARKRGKFYGSRPLLFARITNENVERPRSKENFKG